MTYVDYLVGLKKKEKGRKPVDPSENEKRRMKREGFEKRSP